MANCYIVGDVRVDDPDRYKDYSSQTQSTLDPFGGRFIVRGGEHETLEGEWRPNRLVVIEFPSKEAAQGWYDSEGYRSIIAIRHEASSGSLVLVDGYDG